MYNIAHHVRSNGYIIFNVYNMIDLKLKIHFKQIFVLERYNVLNFKIFSTNGKYNILNEYLIYYIKCIYSTCISYI